MQSKEQIQASEFAVALAEIMFGIPGGAAPTGIVGTRKAGRGPIAPVRPRAGVGRNDPCSCGSGKKSKKCGCGRRG